MLRIARIAMTDARSLAFAAAGIAALILMVTSIPAAANDDRLDYGYDRPGGDLTVIDIPFQSNSLLTFEMICRGYCHNNFRCKSWTLVLPGYQGPLARCWLKKRIMPRVKNKCCVSGEGLERAG